MKWRVVVAIAWLVALVVHRAVITAPPESVAPGMQAVEVAAAEGAVRVAFRDQNPEAGDVALLLHGSPGSASNFDALCGELPSTLRLITPDLPGFGSSTRELDDYSFARHAADMIGLLDSLGVGQVHLVGMSMGGGVALEMARLQPGRVHSITLLSSIGFQEYELTGDYWTNRSLHLLQTAIVWTVDHLVPHFGLLDSGGQGWSYVRNFLDSDQRKLEELILRWDGPVLIVHGERDFLVPADAARAHAAAMPQSRLELYEEGSHFLIWTRPAEIAAQLGTFFDSAVVGQGGFAARPRSAPELTPLSGPGRWIVLVSAAIGAALIAPAASWWFVPFAVSGRIGLPLLLLVLVAGSGVRTAVRRRRAPRQGVAMLVRRAVGVTAHAGLLFVLADFIELRTPSGFFFAVLVWFAASILWRARTTVGRSRLRGQWLRMSRWEYWPSWLVYAPIVPALLWRARRFGGLRVATCVNPPIPLGGLVGESKAQILGEIGDREELPRWTLVAPGEREERRRIIEEFAASLHAKWPLVLKPDRGERGTGVRIVRSGEEIDAALKAVTIPMIAQEYVPGLEFGVFWYRAPDGGGGKVFSVSHKEPVFVTGDGATTLDRLLCSHARVLPLLDHMRDAHSAVLREIPRSGEQVRVTELGTHSLGATFRNSMHLRSEELARAVDALMAASGLDFGRFDIRVPSEEDLVDGRSLRVIEFNGLSGEAAHVYDPDNSLAVARSILLEQWTIALRIGERNRTNGVRPASWREIWRALRAHGGDRVERGG